MTHLFQDRADAARQLAQRLALLRLHKPLVLAIPRGAVPMGAIIADALHGDLDVVLVHKLGSPFDPEFAIGAIDERGTRMMAPEYRCTEMGRAWIEQESASQLATLRARRATYGQGRPPADPCGRTVVVVDDGLATGATMAAALRAVRAELPLGLIAAVPVAAPQAMQHIRPLADRVVCLHAPEYFSAVSLHYAAFPQVEEEEVLHILHQRFAVQTPIPQNR